MAPSPHRFDPCLTAADIKACVEGPGRVQFNDGLYEAIAQRLNREVVQPSSPQPKVKPVSRPDEGYWDLNATTKAVRCLRKSIPGMLDFWRESGQQPSGYDPITALSAALQRALPFIATPFGTATAEPPMFLRKRCKTWHAPAIKIAEIVSAEMIRQGRKPSLARNSIVARVTTKALIKMGFVRQLEEGAVAMHLTRWEKELTKV